MKKPLSVFLVTVLCISLCSCGKEYNQAMDLLGLVEAHDFYAAHELLNEMAGEDAVKWVPDYSYSYEPDYSDDYSDSCGDIGSGSDFWNGDSTCEPSDSYNEPVVEEPKDIPVEGITLSTTEINIEYGETASITAAVYPENTTEYVGDIRFESSDPGVVYVGYWDGNVETRGTGTATITASWDDHTATCVVNVSNPQIETAEELWAIKEFKKGVTYEIVADLDMHGFEYPGYYPEIYGTIEGNGHTISNVEYSGFLGSVYNTGMIRNLTVECNVSVRSEKEYDTFYFGGIVHENNGLIERCVIKGTAEIAYDGINAGGIAWSSNGRIYQCVSEMHFILGTTTINPLGVPRTSYYVYAGGLVGEGNVSECYSLATVTFAEGVDGSFGGIAYEPYTVEDCYNLAENTSAYGAGICAANFGTIKNCVNYGNVNAGIVGHCSGYVIDCYYVISKSPARAIDNGPLSAHQENENDTRTRVHGLTDEAVSKQESYPTLDFENVWVMGPDGYPILKWQQEQ